MLENAGYNDSLSMHIFMMTTVWCIKVNIAEHFNTVSSHKSVKARFFVTKDGVVNRHGSTFRVKALSQCGFTTKATKAPETVNQHSKKTLYWNVMYVVSFMHMQHGCTIYAVLKLVHYNSGNTLSFIILWKLNYSVFRPI